MSDDRGRAAVILDKDGTLIDDLPYNVDPRRIRLAPGADAAIRALAAAGWPFVVATNQSGVARGYFEAADLDRVHDHLRAEIEGRGGTLLGFYACPHHPEGVNAYAVACDCRKPLPGLLRRAAAELGLDLAASWFVGDAWMDAAAGRAAGCRTILVGRDAPGALALPPGRRPDHAVRDLEAAARIILAEAPAPASAPAPAAAPASATTPARAAR